ncbi:LapA family protein [Algicola sagamiensis]|uniref:lipopolysaccharide assembly protein LapA domain-containing protein n=1 Tax=Algicola sagamiensis TaxID=163869 RepID=UPI0003A95AFB|nr:lipopolysaccharide assembly protein LapA domain-containing protein [Algicola sagamiensis]
MRKILGLIFFVSLCLLLFVFGSQNQHTVEVNYVIAKSSIMVSELMVISLAIGLCIGIAIQAFKKNTKTTTKRSLQND